MDEEAFYAKRNDRQNRYAGRVLPPDRYIVIQADGEYAGRYDGQVAIITAANLLSRMTPSLALDIPDVQISSKLPFAGSSLREFIYNEICKNDPFNKFVCRPAEPEDYLLHFGRTGSPATIHGTGWKAHVGNSASPLAPVDDPNPIGPAFAAIIAVEQLFKTNMLPLTGAHTLDAFHWCTDITSDEQGFVHGADVGHIWFVGAGSVGSAAMYFMPFATVNFSATIPDMDEVGYQNIDRSPIFVAEDARLGLNKAKVAAEYLKRMGVRHVYPKPVALHQTNWPERNAGTPDIVVSAANELNVRYYIESGSPPIQIYATTGRNWQATLFTHVPMDGECSCCVFPPEKPAPAMACAQTTIQNTETGKQVDAALPFLSFAAGLMTVAEIMKLQVDDYASSTRRVMLEMTEKIRVLGRSVEARSGCICGMRAPQIHRAMIEETKYYRPSQHVQRGNYSLELNKGSVGKNTRKK